MWNVDVAIRRINETYELDADLDAYNYRAHLLLEELRQQTELYACSGGIWTQTTDVEGEVNGCKLLWLQTVFRPLLIVVDSVIV